MSVPVLNPEGLPTGQATFAGRVAEQEIKPHLIHETVVAELGARRAGTHSTKTRAEVRGGGKKPWRQKGTGRARQGSIRAPHWTGGGVVFGPTPRSHGGKVNRKVRVQAFRSALRAHAERGSVALMEPTGWDSPSTKRAADYLYQAPDGLADRALLVILEDPESVEGMSFRNLSDVYVLAAIDVEVVDLMAARPACPTLRLGALDRQRARGRIRRGHRKGRAGAHGPAEAEAPRKEEGHRSQAEACRQEGSCCSAGRGCRRGDRGGA
jgi:large subunit ribosomal protein L4